MEVSYDPRLKAPFRLQITGASQSGKSWLAYEILKHTHELIDNPPEYIIWCYGEHQDLFREMETTIPNIQFHEGIPTNLDDIIHHPKHGIIVLDDLLSEISDSKWLTNLFTKVSHHRKLSVIFISQNIFHQGKEMRNIGLNTDYYCIFKSPRDSSQIVHLAKQTHPTNVKFIQESYLDATQVPHSYILLDLKMSTPEIIRVRSQISFPQEITYVYIPKKKTL